jgi:DNA uptake protein ComE-like DNA-binding protein
MGCQAGPLSITHSSNPDTATFSGYFFGDQFMSLKHISFGLTAAAMWLCAHQAMAFDHQTGQPAVPEAKASAPSGKLPIKPTFSKAKRDAKVKPVDINTASKAALKKLPGITDADADKIIANRPYGSKAWLVTHNVIPEKTYHGLSALIQAGQAPLAPSKKASTPNQHSKK